jgi:type IV pilus assembly protein PilA
MKKEVKKNNKGFSLVELIVVIAIMAVLVGVLAPQFIKYVEKSRESTDIQNLSSIGDTLQTYFADHKCSASITVTLGTAVSGSEATAALANGGFGTTIAMKGDWTTAPSVTYDPTNTSVVYNGDSTYYEANNATEFTSK